MNYAVEIGSCALIYIPSFIKTGSDIPPDTRTYRQHGDLISLLLFFQNKESHDPHHHWRNGPF
jgi:hypothetical protein